MIAAIDELLTAREVADELKVSVEHISRLARGMVDGVPPLPHLLIGKKKRLFKRSSLERWKTAAEKRDG